MQKSSTRPLLTLSLLLCSGLSSAACRVNISSVNIPIPGSITLEARSVPVGGALSGWLGTGITSRVFDCSNNGTNVSTHVTGRSAAGTMTYSESGQTYSVFPTGVEGVGVVIAARDPNTNWVGVRQATRVQIIRGPYGPMGIGHQAKFIRTGNLAGGSRSMSRQQVATLHAVGWTPPEATSALWLNGATLIISAPTCDLSAGDVNRTIQLDPIRLSSFTGSWLGKKTFDLTANCQYASGVTFRFTGTPASGNSTLFANTGSASGVGLWLYSRIGGSESTLSNNATRSVNVSSNRAVLPLGAAYHKSTGTVTKGTLVSTVTVGITYN